MRISVSSSAGNTERAMGIEVDSFAAVLRNHVTSAAADKKHLRVDILLFSQLNLNFSYDAGTDGLGFFEKFFVFHISVHSILQYFPSRPFDSRVQIVIL